MALKSGDLSSVANKAGISRETLQRWITEFGEDVRDVIEVDGITVPSENLSIEEIMEKYEQTLKLLGEKEIEAGILKTLLKKDYSSK